MSVWLRASCPCSPSLWAGVWVALLAASVCPAVLCLWASLWEMVSVLPLVPAQHSSLHRAWLGVPLWRWLSTSLRVCAVLRPTPWGRRSCPIRVIWAGLFWPVVPVPGLGAPSVFQAIHEGEAEPGHHPRCGQVRVFWCRLHECQEGECCVASSGCGRVAGSRPGARHRMLAHLRSTPGVCGAHCCGDQLVVLGAESKLVAAACFQDIATSSTWRPFVVSSGWSTGCFHPGSCRPPELAVRLLNPRSGLLPHVCDWRQCCSLFLLFIEEFQCHQYHHPGLRDLCSLPHQTL